MKRSDLEYNVKAIRKTTEEAMSENGPKKVRKSILAAVQAANKLTVADAVAYSCLIIVMGEWLLKNDNNTLK